MAWAFQKESELLQIFNYYLDKLQQSGVIDRLRKKFIGDSSQNTDASKMQNIIELSLEDVSFPFVALLTGLCVAFMQLAMETMLICKNKCTHEEEKSHQDDEITSEEAKKIIEDIHDLLSENHLKLGGKKFLSQVKIMSTLPDYHP